MKKPSRVPPVASVHEVARATRHAVYQAFCGGFMKANEATAELLATSLMERQTQRPASSGETAG